ncbi:hypothetical protein ZOSMA_209G00290 [Zostera marina]|uniref:Gnk2-homologous domain-containing protein n=1 Tax=Zostera marina TaxID=29655 RepID=A0A0K9PL70_ZOSMR|nr:hypothetical protein ZOSMA_209G00290 [Zostera marina]
MKSQSLSTRHHFFFVFLLFILICVQPLCSYAKYYQFIGCDSEDGTYTTDGEYHQNLKIVMEALLNNTPQIGFEKWIKDSKYGMETVYGLAMCRGDLNSDECYNCLEYTINLAMYECRNMAKASVFLDSCYVRYADNNFFGHADLGGGIYENKTSIYVGNTKTYMALRDELLDDLTLKATNGKSTPRFYATGDVVVSRDDDCPDSQVFALVQCTRDVSTCGCKKCLDHITKQLPDQCGLATGAAYLLHSCFLMYDDSVFFKQPPLPPPPPPPSPPPPPQPTPAPSPCESLP